MRSKSARSRIQTSRKWRPKLLCEHEILEESMESVIGVGCHPEMPVIEPCRFWLLELRVFSTFLNILRFICSGHGYPAHAPAITSCLRSGRFRLRELRVSRHFTSAHLFSPWIPHSRAANTTRPRSYRLWLLELRVSRHFSTFYGPSVQSMDIQLCARHRRRTPTIHRGRAQRTTSAGSVVVASWEKMAARE